VAQQPDDARATVTAKPFLHQIKRYTSVGLICAIIQNLIMIGSGPVGLHYLPATLISVAVVVPLGYYLHCRYTFGQDRSVRSFLRFAGGFVIAYPFYLALIALFCTGFGWAVAIAAPLTTVILFLFNYVWARWAIVHRAHVRDGSDFERDAALPKRSSLQSH
jgi:putative flippase GtrA